MGYKKDGKVGMFHEEGAILQCDMSFHCTEAVSMIEEKGFVYCGNHGLTRSMYGHKVRKLRKHELNRLGRGEALQSY